MSRPPFSSGFTRRRFLASSLLSLAPVSAARAAKSRSERSALGEAAEFSAAHGGSAFLVKKDGRTILASGHAQEAHKIYSGTKAFWILAALRASEEGIVRLDEKVSVTIPEWAEDPAKAGISLAELLNFTSGLDPEFHLHSAVADRNRTALAAPVVAAPGSAFIYGPASLQVFEEVLRRKLAARGDTPIHYLERKVLRPLGLGPQRYMADSAGQPLLATGFLLTAEQWSRIGDVILNHGRPVVSPGTFQQCLRGTSANEAFGMALWNNRAARGGHDPDIEDLLELNWRQQRWGGVCLSRHAPPDVIAAIGSKYQRLYVFPSRNLVVVRFGNGVRCSDSELLRLVSAA